MSDIIPSSPNAMFYPTDGDKNLRSSIAKYIQWLDDNALHWMKADLKDYRDYCLQQYKRSTAKKHLERIRARYRDMLNSNELRDAIQAQIPRGATPADRYAITEEFLKRLANNTQYDKRVAIKLPTVTAYVDSDFTWLTPDEIDAIIDAIPRGDLIGYRDAAMIALLYTYGLREAETCAVTVQDLRETQDNGQTRGVLIRQGKGMVRGFVRLDEITDYTAQIEDWLTVAQITSGHVLRGFDFNTGAMSDSLSPRQLAHRVKSVSGVSPHNLRRSYAKNLHNAGRDLNYIRQQLRHASISTSLRYIGVLGNEDRR